MLADDMLRKSIQGLLGPIIVGLRDLGLDLPQQLDDVIDICVGPLAGLLERPSATATVVDAQRLEERHSLGMPDRNFANRLLLIQCHALSSDPRLGLAGRKSSD